VIEQVLFAALHESVFDPKQSWTICADKRVDTARCAIEADMPDGS
jgi:hypothetical protein